MKLIMCRCGNQKLIKYGIDRQGRYPRQCYMCGNGHTTLEPREWPLGKEFQSEPWKLLKALRLMKSGKKSLRKIADAAQLDRYTIYKLHNHVGRPFKCVCGRPLGHHGHCKPTFDKSAAIRKALDDARSIRRISKPSEAGFRMALKALERVTNHLKELEDEGR